MDRARYAIGDVKISLPTIIDKGGGLLGKVTGDSNLSPDTAVTLDDVIVFPRELDFTDTSDLAWIAHEVFHVWQYQQWGIDQFAFNYLKNHKAVEDQAIAQQSYVYSYLQNIGKNEPIKPQVTFVGTASYVAKEIQTPLGQSTIFEEAQNSKSEDVTVQPVYNKDTPEDYSASCVVFKDGNVLYITKDDRVLSRPDNYQQIGFRVKPGAVPECYFDLILNTGKACAKEIQQTDPVTNVTYYGYDVYLKGVDGQLSVNVGRCSSCGGSNQYCP